MRAGMSRGVGLCPPGVFVGDGRVVIPLRPAATTLRVIIGCASVMLKLRLALLSACTIIPLT